jgi:hypothetical protein
MKTFITKLQSCKTAKLQNCKNWNGMAQNNLAGTNTLTYFACNIRAQEKNFLTLIPWDCTIKPFTGLSECADCAIINLRRLYPIPKFSIVKKFYKISPNYRKE